MKKGITMMVLFNNAPTRAAQDTMTDTKKQSRTKDTAKKIVSLTIDPLLISRLDAYAADKKISRSATIEVAITGLLALDARPSMTAAENSLVLPEDCIFASPQLGTAIYF
jgi:hypothetical protein